MTSIGRSKRIEAFDAAMAEAGQLVAADRLRGAFAALERAHVLGQCDFGRHLRVHWSMLRVGWGLADRREVMGQWMRIVLVPLGHLFGQLPAGNTGGANVNAFEPMAISPEIAHLLREDDR